MKNILVIGAGGYVGSLLTERLLMDGNLNVVTLDRFWFSDPLPAQERLRNVTGDIRNPASVQEAMVGIDTVIHLACVSNDPSFDLDPRFAKSINSGSLYSIALEARRAGVKNFIFASSSSVYGACGDRCMIESDTLNPLTDYAKYKMMSEQYLVDIIADTIPVTILRPATLFGATERAMRFDLMLNSFVAQAVEHGKIMVRGGEQRRALLHVSDMVDLYVRLATESDLTAIRGKVWNVVAENITIRNLAAIVASIITQCYKPVSISFVSSDDNRSYSISSDAIIKEYGFAPSLRIEQGIEELADTLWAGGYTNPNTDKYIRLLKYKRIIDEEGTHAQLDKTT